MYPPPSHNTVNHNSNHNDHIIQKGCIKKQISWQLI